MFLPDVSGKAAVTYALSRNCVNSSVHLTCMLSSTHVRRNPHKCSACLGEVTTAVCVETVQFESRTGYDIDLLSSS